MSTYFSGCHHPLKDVVSINVCFVQPPVLGEYR